MRIYKAGRDVPESVGAISRHKHPLVQHLEILIRQLVRSIHLRIRSNRFGLEGRELQVPVDVGEAVGRVDRRGVGLLDVGRVGGLTCTPELWQGSGALHRGQRESFQGEFACARPVAYDQIRLDLPPIRRPDLPTFSLVDERPIDPRSQDDLDPKLFHPLHSGFVQGGVESVEEVRARMEEGDFLGLTVCGDDVRGHL
jgi:hypothetical protein